MLSHFNSLRDLVAAWYQIDRVRISPSTGRLLGLKPGNRFIFRCESFDVVTRDVQQTATGHELVYTIASSLGDGSLVVAHIDGTDTTTGELTAPRLKTTIFDSDIVVLNEAT
jgi:hypothetical protein